MVPGRRSNTITDEVSMRREEARLRSRAAWNTVASGWCAKRRELWRVSRPVSEWLVRKLDPQPGDTVLELAAGPGDTGLLAARLVGESGRVIITDFAPGMIDAARRRAEEVVAKNAEVRVLDAERMDLDTDSADGILCRWGYMLMTDPAAAFVESRRVLRPGGRVAFSVWATRERNPVLSLVGAVLESQGHVALPDPEAPGAFAMADPDRIRELVLGAGFAELEIEEVSFRWPFADRNAYWRYLMETSASSSPMLRALPPEARARVREQLHEAARPFHSGEGYDFPAVCLNVLAR